MLAAVQKKITPKELLEGFIPAHKDIWLFGRGATAKEFHKRMKECGVSAAGFVVSSPESDKAETGEPILSITQFQERAQKLDGQGLLLTVDEKYHDELTPALAFLGGDLAVLKEHEMHIWLKGKAGKQDVKKIWESDLHQEEEEWERFLQEELAAGAEPYYRYRRAPVPEAIVELLPKEANEYDILDVGSGPRSFVGYKIEGKVVRLSCCDPLADRYTEFFRKNNIEQPVKPIKQDGERLLETFSFNQFDCVAARNCLDHAYSPEQCILQMATVSKRYVYLLHLRNEAENALYSGLHNWNFDVEEGDFVIRGINGKVNANSPSLFKYPVVLSFIWTGIKPSLYLFPIRYISPLLMIFPSVSMIPSSQLPKVTDALPSEKA